MKYYILTPKQIHRDYVFLSQYVDSRYVKAWRDNHKVIEITKEMRLFLMSIVELPRYVNNDDTHIMVEL